MESRETKWQTTHTAQPSERKWEKTQAGMTLAPLDEDQTEWESTDPEHRRRLEEIYRKFGGPHSLKEEVADKMWALVSNMNKNADQNMRQVMEGAVAAIRHGCGNHKEIDIKDIKLTNEWIEQYQKEAVNRISEKQYQQMQQIEEKRLRQQAEQQMKKKQAEEDKRKREK